MLDFSIGNLLHANIINIIIMLAILVAVFNKLQFSKKLEDMLSDVINTIKNSDEKKANSQKTLETAELEMSKLPAEIDKIMQNAHNTAEGFKTKIEKDIATEHAELEKNAQKVMDNELNKVNSALKKEISENALNSAKEKLQKSLNENDALHRKLIQKAIEDIERLEI